MSFRLDLRIAKLHPSLFKDFACHVGFIIDSVTDNIVVVDRTGGKVNATCHGVMCAHARSNQMPLGRDHDANTKNMPRLFGYKITAPIHQRCKTGTSETRFKNPIIKMRFRRQINLAIEQP